MVVFTIDSVRFGCSSPVGWVRFGYVLSFFFPPSFVLIASVQKKFLFSSVRLDSPQCLSDSVQFGIIRSVWVGSVQLKNIGSVQFDTIGSVRFHTFGSVRSSSVRFSSVRLARVRSVRCISIQLCSVPLGSMGVVLCDPNKINHSAGAA